MSEPINAGHLERSVIFNELTEKDVERAIKDIQIIKLNSGDTLFNQGDTGDSIFFVVRGELNVVLPVPGGGECVVSSVGPNNVIGEMSLFLDEPRSATVVAATDAELWCVARDSFLESISWNERWANQFLHYMARILARRLANMNEELVSLVMQNREDEEDAVRRQQIQMLQRYVFSSP